MKITSKSLLLVCGSFVVGVLLATMTGIFAIGIQSDKPAKNIDKQINLDILQRVISHVESSYIKEVTQSKLLSYAIKGMLTGLDPHSDYLDPDAVGELSIRTKGKFGGLGITVTMENGLVKVIAPLDNTPAARAGIKSQDLIIKLDNTPVKGMTLMEAIHIMRGTPGTSIELTIFRENEAKPLVIKIQREIIKVKSVRAEILDKGYLYIRISNFQQNTAAEIKKVLTAETDKYKKTLQGIVLDLRNNPGGLLTAAIEVSDLFINKGLIVYTKGRIASAASEFKATSNTPAQNIPTVVLINSGSASASEIVAGALQDHKRAIIMGEKSFGKGTVQSVFPITSDGSSMIKLTTAAYYTPSGASIQAEGIVPDIEVRNGMVEEVNKNFASTKEADLTNHIINENTKQDKTKLTVKNLNKDFQINQAVNLLKGINVSHKILDK